MSEDNFLTRWSRRKREAEDSDAAPAPLDENSAPEVSAAPGSKGPDEEFDLASLPPIESITSATDVTAFLRAGVPLDLTRAALRRAWSADPAIRDFIGIAENQWDFTKPGAMRGFGPLDYTAEQVRQLVSEIMGGARPPVDIAAPASSEMLPAPLTASESSTMAPPSISGSARQEDVPPDPEPASVPDLPAETSNRRQFAAVQNDAPDIAELARRTHGSALPR